MAKNWDFCSFQMLCIEEAPNYVPTFWIFDARVSYMSNLLSKNRPLYVNFSIFLFAK
jgi:hypothetical protein